MCTLSWFADTTAYHVFFNRDEGVSRQKAIPPSIVQASRHKFIMPLDPLGGGSWMCVNERGYTFALLNYYQGSLPKGRLLSRGQIIREMGDCSSSSQCEKYLKSLNLRSFAPFSMLIFEPEMTVPDKNQKFSVAMYRWTGRILEQKRQSSPLFSSAVDYKQVSESRMAVYHAKLAAANTRNCDIFYALHASHLPEKSARSICMHRGDASTVSFSHVSVSAEKANYVYVDGAPCESNTPVSLSIRIRK